MEDLKCQMCDWKSVRKLLAVRVWRLNGQTPPVPTNCSTDSPPHSSTFPLLLAQSWSSKSTEPENTNPKAEHSKPTCSRSLAGSEEPRLSLGREWLMPLWFHHLFPAHPSPGSSHPTLRQDWLCAFAMDFEEMQNLQHQGPVQQFCQQTFTKN